MRKSFLTYLRTHKITDIITINRLFLSIYILSNNYNINKNNHLRDLKITETNDDASLLVDLISIITRNNYFKVSLEDLINLFEFVISPSDRIVSGAIYTPKNIRKIIISNCFEHLSLDELYRVRVCDISCGCGGFLMDVAEYIHTKTNKTFKDIFRENIYGIDIQDYSVERTKILLSLLAITYGEDDNFTFNILQADTLDFCSEHWNIKYSSFDIIVGNPPYVCSRNVSAVTKEKMLRYEVSHSGHPDLYIPFFQIAYEMLNNNGVMGYITMNSFIHSVNGRSLRQYFSSKNIDISIVDFRGHQVFDKKSTYTCLFYLNKGNRSDGVRYFLNEKGCLEQQFKFSYISYKSLDNQKGWNLNDNLVTENIESVGIPLGKYCSSRHGIATLSNKTYIFKPINEDGMYYYLEDNGSLYQIEKSICRDVVNSNKLNSNINFNSIIEKVIYPYYKNSNNQVCIIEEKRMKKEFPYAYKYLLLKKEVLLKRDKNKTQKYPAWYAYGRTQSLQMPKYKLFFPKFANSPLKCVICDNTDLLLYNGVAFVSDSEEKLLVVKKIIESLFFWEYIVKKAKPYSSGYYSLSGVDIKNFGVPYFTEEEKRFLLESKDNKIIDKWLSKFYRMSQQHNS